MAAEEGWLSLKVSERKQAASPRSSKRPYVISIRKKIVPLAVRRNRIRRLIREAIRLEGFFAEPGKVYWLQVRRPPSDDKVLFVQESLRALSREMKRCGC